MTRNSASIRALASGLRRLGLFAKVAPVSAAEFAAAARMPLDEAAALLAVFQETGFIAAVHGTEMFDVTPLAITTLAGVGAEPCHAYVDGTCRLRRQFDHHSFYLLN